MTFVGRERELAQLASALQRAAEGRLTPVAVTAAAGMGASRLVEELAKRLAGVPGVIVARGCAMEPAAGEAYQAPIEALRAALAAVPDERLPAIVAGSGFDLCALFPDFAPTLDALGIEHVAPRFEAPDQLGSRVAESLIGILARLPGDGVLLLALEDLHWADPATRALLRSLIRVSRPMPICLVVTYRPEELHRRHPARELPDLFGSETGTEVIRLGRLERRDLELMISSLRAERPSGDLVAAVTEGAGGNPLVALQLLAGEEALEGIRLSDSFEQIVIARLAALPASSQQVVRLLAAARQALPGRQVSRVLAADGRLPPGALEQAIESGLVINRAGVLAISHDLYAEAIEDLELPSERVRSHRMLASLLADHPARAAWHHERASQPQGARDAHVAAAEAASRLDPGKTSLLHFLRALELDADADSPERDPATGLLLERAARAAAAAGTFRQAAALLRRAIDARAALGGQRRRDDGQRRALGTLHEELGRHLWAGGDLVGARDAMEQALALIPAEPSRARASAVATYAQYLMVDGRFAESASHATEAIDIAAALAPPAIRERGHAACTLGVDLAYLGELDRGLAMLEQAAALARRVGRLDDLMRVAANLTTMLDLDARREQALAVVSEGMAAADRAGLAGTYGAFLRGNAADILFQLGRWAEAERECRAAMEWQPAGVAWFSPTLYLGLVLVESRGDQEAAHLVGQTMLQLDTVPVGQWTALVHRSAVSHALWTGDAADAVAVARRGWPRVLETDEPAQVSLAASTCLEAAAAAAEDARARRDMPALADASELAHAVLPAAEQQVAASTLAPTLGTRIEADLHLATARAHHARVLGRSSPAEWRGIAEAWRQRSIPYLAAKAYWWEALAALNAGRPRSEAAEPVREALSIAQRLPALPLQRALSDLVARGRLPIPNHLGRQVGEADAAEAAGPGQPGASEWTTVGRAIAQRLGGADDQRAAPFGLTPREFEVLTILSEGRTDREIAERLFISERTVQVHTRRVLAKLGVSSRTQAASLAIRQGVVTLRA
jgi:DNA-binding CsgD family transcriptional regulator/tetratricopeptide (TPR) repeat protein